MHTITVTFEDKEFEELKKIKNEIADANWHDFIRVAALNYRAYMKHEI